MSAFPLLNCVDALAGAGAPAAFRVALRDGTVEADAVDAGLRRVCALDSAPPELLSGPLLGRTLAELTGCGPAAEESEMDSERKPRHGRPPEAARPVCPEPVERSARPVATPCGSRPRAERAPVHPAKPVATVVPVAPDRPDPGKIGVERLRSLAGPPPVPARTPVRRATPPVEPAAVPHRGPPVPSKVDAAAELPSSLARGVAKRVRADCEPALAKTLGEALRPGPIAPAGLLERIAFGQVRGGRPEPAKPREEARRPAAWREGTPRPAARPPENEPTTHPVPVPGTDRPHPPTPAEHHARAPEEPEVAETPKRLSAQFAELPEIPRRERVSAPGRSNPDDVAKPSPPAENTVSEADLELMMHRILDNAARRHGIEV